MATVDMENAELQAKTNKNALNHLGRIQREVEGLDNKREREKS